jgi:hypothetical protein
MVALRDHFDNNGLLDKSQYKESDSKKSTKQDINSEFERPKFDVGNLNFILA